MAENLTDNNNEAPTDNTGDLAALITRIKSKAKSLREELAHADGTRAAEILRELSSLAGSVPQDMPDRGILLGSIQEAIQLAQAQVNQDPPRPATTTEVVAMFGDAVMNSMSQPQAQDMYNSFNRPHLVINMAPDGTMPMFPNITSPGATYEMSGEELREAFAHLGFGSLDDPTREKIRNSLRTRLQGLFGNLTGNPAEMTEAEEAQKLHEALKKMEQYKAYVIASNVELSDTQKEEMKEANRRTFLRAHAQIDRVVGLYERMADAPEGMRAPLQSLLNKEREELRRTLKEDVIDGILLDIPSARKMISGGVNVGSPQSGLTNVANAPAGRSGSVMPA